MNALRAAAAKHAAAIDATSGEPLRLLRGAKVGRSGGGGGKASGAEPVDFVGTVTRRSVEIQRQGVGAQGATNVQIVDARWQVSFPVERATALGIKAGDTVERLDPPPGEPARLRLSEPFPIRGRMIHPANEV